MPPERLVLLLTLLCVLGTCGRTGARRRREYTRGAREPEVLDRKLLLNFSAVGKPPRGRVERNYPGHADGDNPRAVPRRAHVIKQLTILCLLLLGPALVLADHTAPRRWEQLSAEEQRVLADARTLGHVATGTPATPAARRAALAKNDARGTRPGARTFKQNGNR